MLWMYQRVIYGKLTKPENEKLTDLDAREKLVLVPLVVMVFWIGVYPSSFTSRIEPAVEQILSQVGRAQSVQVPLPVNSGRFVESASIDSTQTVVIAESGK
jgi:NADH-quinone oxidoreductase subunit M